MKHLRLASDMYGLSLRPWDRPDDKFGYSRLAIATERDWKPISWIILASHRRFLSRRQKRYRTSGSVLAALLTTGLLVATVLTRSVSANPTSAPGETAEGVFGERTSRIDQPDSKTGAMSWNYPFKMISVRERAQPRLALSYNSPSSDREAGFGWDLNLPVIERKPLSANPCFAAYGTPIACGERRLDARGRKLVSQERYIFSGQPLTFTCQLSGAQAINDPACGNTQPHPDWASSAGWRYFRLQVEGQFSKFYLSEKRRYWRVSGDISTLYKLEGRISKMGC